MIFVNLTTAIALPFKKKSCQKCDYEINSSAPSVRFKIKLIPGLTIKTRYYQNSGFPLLSKPITTTTMLDARKEILYIISAPLLSRWSAFNTFDNDLQDSQWSSLDQKSAKILHPVSFTFLHFEILLVHPFSNWKCLLWNCGWPIIDFW